MSLSPFSGLRPRYAEFDASAERASLSRFAELHKPSHTQSCRDINGGWRFLWPVIDTFAAFSMAFVAATVMGLIYIMASS